MSIYYQDDLITLRHGDVRDELRSLPDAAVQTIVTSPPYWSLRDYGVEPSVWGGDPECAHSWESAAREGETYAGRKKWQHEGVSRQETLEQWVRPDRRQIPHGDGRANDSYAKTRVPYPAQTPDAFRSGGLCERCGAWLGCLGLEPTPELFTEHLVLVFREVRRVLRDDGTLWLNLGDSYAGSGGAHTKDHANPGLSRSAERDGVPHYQDDGGRGKPKVGDGLKPKDLVGIPWRAAFALQADGWYLRADIIWSKPNPMPESVTDRPTKSHEYVFLLSKRERYYYDADAVREPSGGWNGSQFEDGKNAIVHPNVGKRRSGNKERKLGGVAENGRLNTHLGSSGPWEGDTRNLRSVWTIPTASFPGSHFAVYPVALVIPCIMAGSRPGDIVLDPFNGAGTTGLVASRLGRRYIGIDLNEDYLRMAQERIAGDAPLLHQSSRQALSDQADAINPMLFPFDGMTV